MDPIRSELMSFANIGDIFGWLEATKEIEEAVTAAMGATASLRTWAHIPDERFHAEVRILKVGERSLTPAEEGQVGQVGQVPRLPAHPHLGARRERYVAVRSSIQSLDPASPTQGGEPAAGGR